MFVDMIDKTITNFEGNITNKMVSGLLSKLKNQTTEILTIKDSIAKINNDLFYLSQTSKKF